MLGQSTEGPTEWKAFARQRLRWKYGRFLTFLQYRHLFFSTVGHRRHG